MTPHTLHKKIVEQLIAKDISSQRQLAKEIRTLAGSFDIAAPKKSDLLKAYHDSLKNKSINASKKFEHLLKKREVRTISGVAPIAVLTKPFFCPGRCAFCPTEARMPKSYLSNEPAVMRAVLNQWDPYKQVSSRLEALQRNGHATDKCELIVIGGTWSFLPKRYQTWYIKRLFDALNGKTSKSLKEAQKLNETAKNRAVGMCLETRPDYITTEEIKRMRDLGCTRVEIGLQSTDAGVLKLNKRGHGVETVRRATKLLRDAGFKISYHMMPNLPGSTPRKDIQSFVDIFNDPSLKPDMLKIYPCVVVKDAEIYQWWRNGSYKPYNEKTLFDTLVKIKKLIPPYVRVTRLIRDIPTTSIYAGNMIANLRQQVLEELKKQGQPCCCIRCREPKNESAELKNMDLHDLVYEAAEGIEHFLSLESGNQHTLYAFIRLRLPRATNPALIKKIPELKGAAVIRELHTYGTLTPLDQEVGGVQHKGLGKKLLSEAEKIAKKAGFEKIAIISGVGVREYYKMRGYKLSGTYMVKNLN